PHAFFYSEGRLINLDAMLGGRDSVPEAINAAGQGVGNRSYGYPVTNAAFLYSAGQMFDLQDDLPPPDFYWIPYVKDINDAGQILFDGHRGAGEEERVHSFLLTPITTKPSVR